MDHKYRPEATHTEKSFLKNTRRTDYSTFDERQRQRDRSEKEERSMFERKRKNDGKRKRRNKNYK